MSHIKTELIEQSVPLYSVRLIECLRLFDLIQENIPEPKSFLTCGNLESFLKNFLFPNFHNSANKIMYLVSRNGNEITSELFAARMATYLKHVELTNEQSLADFYNKLKEVLSFTDRRPLQRYQQWDIDTNMTPQTLKDRQNNIGVFYSQLQPFIEGMQLYMFQNYLEKLNYCLSVITISSLQSEVFKVYKTFINPTVMNHISDFLVTIGQLEANPQQVNTELLQNVLSQKQNMVSYFALISHFYSACKYRELKERLDTTPCLFYHETYKTILLAIKIPEVKIQQQVAICLCMMSSHIQTFNNWVLSDMYNNLMPLLTSVSLLKDEETTYFTLICVKNIMRRYQKMTEQFKEDNKNHEMLGRIQTFSFFQLGLYNNYELQKECFLLIAEILKVCPINFKQIQELKLTTKVFELQIDYQAALVPAALTILEVSIHRKLDEITNMIINDPGFLACLQSNFGVQESIFFYQFLHIVYLLSYTHTNYLFEKNLLAKTLEMMFKGTNPTVSSIGSDILLNAVQQALQNEQILEILYEKLAILDQVVPFLFTKCFAKSDCLNLLLIQNNNVPDYNYFDKYILNNFFKILYSLAVGVNRKHKKYAFLKRVNEEIINSISKILDDMFKSDNHKLIEIVLREKVKISSKKLKLQNGIPLFKLIAMILQELTYMQENPPSPIMKTINRQLKSFGRNLLKSQAFPLHELEVQNIPVYIKIIIEYDKSIIVRDIPHKYDLSSLKAYVKQLVIRGVDRKLNEVKDVTLKYKQNGRVIENEVQYRAIVSKNLENRVTDFEWFVEDIKWRNRRDEGLTSSFMLPNLQQSPRSFREPNPFVTSRSPMNMSRQLPNFGGNRPNLTMRQNAEDPYARRTFSPHNFNYTYDRARSPDFGGRGNRNR